MKLGNWITGALLAVSCLFTSAARADHLAGLQQEAAVLDRYAHALCEEVRLSMRPANNYPVIVAQVEALENRIHLLQDIVARPASRQQLFAQLNVVDRLVINVQNSVFNASRGNAWDPHHHHHGVPTQRVQQLLQIIDGTVHNMEQRVNLLRDCDFHVVQRPVVPLPPYSPSPGFPGNTQPGQYPPTWNNQVPTNWNGSMQPAPSNPWQQILVNGLSQLRSR